MPVCQLIANIFLLCLPLSCSTRVPRAGCRAPAPCDPSIGPALCSLSLLRLAQRAPGKSLHGGIELFPAHHLLAIAPGQTRAAAPTSQNAARHLCSPALAANFCPTAILIDPICRRELNYPQSPPRQPRAYNR